MMLARERLLPFDFAGPMLRICRCSEGCCLPPTPQNITFAGYSKPGARGLIHGASLFVPRSADDWDRDRHAFGVTILRQGELARGDVLRRLLALRDRHLLRLEAICDCSIATEYLRGRQLNARKPTYVLGPGRGQRDALDELDDETLVQQLRGLARALLALHARRVCHTDVTDHNVMSRRAHGDLVLIDLLGCVPATRELEGLDRRLFHDELLRPVVARRPTLQALLGGLSPLQALDALARGG